MSTEPTEVKKVSPWKIILKNYAGTMVLSVLAGMAAVLYAWGLWHFAKLLPW